MTVPLKIDYSLFGIETGRLSIASRPEYFPITPAPVPLELFFRLFINEKVNEQQKVVVCIVNVIVSDKTETDKLVDLELLMFFKVEQFSEYIKKNSDGKYEIPIKVKRFLHKESIATTRGYLFSTLKGTYLHRAIMPLIDPAKMESVQNKDNNIHLISAG